MINILTDRKNGIAKWNYNNNDIIIQNSNMMYAFEYGIEMVMLKIKYPDGKIEFIMYDINGDFILSYMAQIGQIKVGNNKCIQLDDLVSAEYSKTDKKIVALVGIKDDERKLIILDQAGNIIARIGNPSGYSFYYTKNMGNAIMVVCQGNSDETKDKFGRNDWNFRIDLDNYYVERESITQ